MIIVSLYIRDILKNRIVLLPFEITTSFTNFIIATSANTIISIITTAMNIATITATTTTAAITNITAAANTTITTATTTITAVTTTITAVTTTTTTTTIAVTNTTITTTNPSNSRNSFIPRKNLAFFDPQTALLILCKALLPTNRTNRHCRSGTRPSSHLPFLRNDTTNIEVLGEVVLESIKGVGARSHDVLDRLHSDVLLGRRTHASWFESCEHTGRV
ncbi:hypothetical protein FHG87_017466 [Trinorchestia longiramus]|nr:hypothetical protein FHG87_017466 [Trinorchestia longiramus]